MPSPRTSKPFWAGLKSPSPCELIARERAADLYARTSDFFHRARTLDEQASRSLITRISLILENSVLGIFFEGDLVAMLIFATNKKSATHHLDAGVLSKFLVQDSWLRG